MPIADKFAAFVSSLTPAEQTQLVPLIQAFLGSRSAARSTQGRMQTQVPAGAVAPTPRVSQATRGTAGSSRERPITPPAQRTGMATTEETGQIGTTRQPSGPQVVVARPRIGARIGSKVY